MDKLSRHFEGVSLQPHLSMRERTSLARITGRGLARLSLGKPLDQRRHIAPMQDVLGALQNHILDFTQKLHAAELEKRNLKQELEAMKTINMGSQSQKEQFIDHEDVSTFNSKTVIFLVLKIMIL